MTQEQIIEGNKLIAEFMGFEKNGKYNNLDCWFVPDKNPMIQKYSSWGGNMSMTTEGLRFNTSWDWIMSVIEKIESLGYHTNIEYFGEHRVFFSHDCIGERESDKITATYKAVIQFINWYKQNKPK